MFSKFEVTIHNWYLIHMKGTVDGVKNLFEKAYLEGGFSGLLDALHSTADTFHSEQCEYYTDCPNCIKFFKLL
jgi:hypothetical protein